MTSGHPDWSRFVGLIGQDPDGNLVIIRVDADGQLTIPFKGINPDADLATVAVDADGQLYAIMRGAAGEDLLVDGDGFLSAVLKGEKPDTELSNIAVDDDGQIISVMKGASGYSLDVDASGFMTAILKGDYAGALRTIGLDDAGRISGYLVDGEDQWGQILKVGNAEQAARLGSPVSWDRRGQVQLIHTFEHGLKPMASSAYGAGASVQLDPIYHVAGGYSAKLTGGSDGANRFATIDCFLGLPPSNQIGVAIRWAAVPTPDYLQIYMQIFRDGDLTSGSIRYDFDAKRLQYADSEGSYQNLAVQDFYVSTNVWNSMKMVLDHDTGRYIRALLNGTAYDLDAIAAPTSSPGIGNYVWVTIKLISHEGDNDVVYIDTFTITTNEPAN